MEKQEAIENLYLTFNKYTTSDMHYCTCGCTDPENVKKLASKKLRELEEEDYSAYHGSALYTWGEIEHYKHFLPRILEVYNILNGRGYIGLYDIASKLEYAKWETWDHKEIEAITEFILVDWVEFINEKASEISEDDLENYSFFLGIGELLGLWKLSKTGFGLRNFLLFFYYHGTKILNDGLKIRGKIYKNELRELLYSEKLLDLLEKEFFSVDDTDKDYSEKVSVVILMIEQEKALGLM